MGRTAWVIDDDEFWRENVSKYLTRGKKEVEGSSIAVVKQFPTVDLALEEFKKTTPEDRPTVICTDGDTNTEELPSRHTGVDLAKEVKGSGVGVVVVSANRSTPSELAAAGCTAAKYVDKPMIDKTTLHARVDEAIEAAKVEKRLGGSLPGQLSPYAGGRY